jgi:hypothetical protein
MNANFVDFASFFVVGDLNHCQSYFQGTIIRHGLAGFSFYGPSLRHYAVVPKFTELYQRAALTGARNRSVSSWHGMPTASVKDKHFLK